MQQWPPFRILLEIVRHPFRHQNVTRVAAIHHALRDVDARAGNVPLLAQVGNSFHRPAVNPHPHPQLGILLQFARDLERAFHRFFRAFVKYERAAIPRRQTH